MTEPARPSESLSLPFGSAAELLGRITLQLGTQLSGLRPPRPRRNGAPACPPSSPSPTAAGTPAPSRP